MIAHRAVKRLRTLAQQVTQHTEQTTEQTTEQPTRPLPIPRYITHQCAWCGLVMDGEYAGQQREHIPFSSATICASCLQEMCRFLPAPTFSGLPLPLMLPPVPDCLPDCRASGPDPLSLSHNGNRGA